MADSPSIERGRGQKAQVQAEPDSDARTNPASKHSPVDSTNPDLGDHFTAGSPPSLASPALRGSSETHFLGGLGRSFSLSQITAMAGVLDEVLVRLNHRYRGEPYFDIMKDGLLNIQIESWKGPYLFFMRWWSTVHEYFLVRPSGMKGGRHEVKILRRALANGDLFTTDFSLESIDVESLRRYRDFATDFLEAFKSLESYWLEGVGKAIIFRLGDLISALDTEITRREIKTESPRLEPPADPNLRQIEEEVAEIMAHHSELYISNFCTVTLFDFLTQYVPSKLYPHIKVLVLQREGGGGTSLWPKWALPTSSRWPLHVVMVVGGRIYDFASRGRPGEAIGEYSKKMFPGQKVEVCSLSVEKYLGIMMREDPTNGLYLREALGTESWYLFQEFVEATRALYGDPLPFEYLNPQVDIHHRGGSVIDVHTDDESNKVEITYVLGDKTDDLFASRLKRLLHYVDPGWIRRDRISLILHAEKNPEKSVYNATEYELRRWGFRGEINYSLNITDQLQEVVNQNLALRRQRRDIANGVAARDSPVVEPPPISRPHRFVDNLILKHGELIAGAQRLFLANEAAVSSVGMIGAEWLIGALPAVLSAKPALVAPLTVPIRLVGGRGDSDDKGPTIRLVSSEPSETEDDEKKISQRKRERRGITNRGVRNPPVHVSPSLVAGIRGILLRK